MKEGPVIFYPAIEYGGIERNLIGLSDFLHGLGFEATLACFQCVDPEKNILRQRTTERPLKIQVLAGSKNPFSRARLLARYLADESRRTGFCPLLFSIKGAFFMGIRQEAPFILHYTDPPSLLGAPRTEGLLRRLRQAGADHFTRRGVRRAKKMMTMTQRNADELLALYGVRSEVVFQGGTPPRQEAGAVPPSAGAPLNVLSVCRIEDSKRIDWIFRAVARLNDHRPADARVRVEVVGIGGGLDRLRRMAGEMSDRVEVIFHGQLSQDAVEAAFRRAAVFAMPAVQGYGLPALEAIYRNVPVVLHRDSGVHEALGKVPIAVVSKGDEEQFGVDLAATIARIERDEFRNMPGFDVPTEAGWAAEISRLCGWIP